MKKIWSFICALFLGVSCLVGCNKGTNFQLKFMVDDSVYATVNTSGREVIQMPKDPVKEDYTFEGWYWDKDVWRNQFTARSLLDTPLSSNMEVYAHFVDESYLHGTEINIKTAEKVNIEGIGDVFYLRVRNNQLVCKFNDYVEINPHSSWILSTDLAGNNPITTKTVELIVGDNPLYYIYVTDKDERHETYIVLVHRNYMYTVSFNSNGGTSCSSQQVEEGYYLENIPTTTRKGYTFDRWNYDFKNEPIKSNITAKAIWTANNYKITYNPNGGSVSSETQTVTFDEHYSLLTPSRLGYTFKGWKTSSGSYFANSGTWNLDQDISLTAEWEIVYYSIAYELNGGSSSGIVLKSSYTVGDSFTIPSPTRNGYTFKGWSLSSSLSDAEIDYSVSKGTTGNLKFYAKWQANSYTVTYDVNGGDALEENTQTVTYGENTTLANPSREGYDFAGWYNGSNKVSNGDWNIADDVTLTARWEATEYAIKYNLNGGINSSNNPPKYTIESETIVLEDATREGYTFKGWTTDEIAEPTFALTIPHGSTGEKQFTANWTANTYTVTYDVNGGNAIEDNVKEYVYDSDVVLLTPTRPGYNFAGWYYGTQLVDSGTWKIAEDITLVARWSREEFNIQYQLNNGNNDPSNPTSYNYDSETITLADASRVGYTFLGWTSSDIQTPTKGVQIVHNSVGDKLFIANWQANTYTVTYDVNGGNSIGKTSEEIVFDEVLTLINPTRTGYTFSGWYSGNTLYESGVWKTAKDVDLVARWTPNNYTITKENGSGAGTSVVTYDDNYNLGTSSKDGYEFVGWYTEMYGQGTQYADENGNSLNPYTDANDQTLYASFIYHITFVSNGGSYVPSLTLHENECLSESIVSEKENRTFAGWFTNPELTQPVSYSQPLGNITLYAKWAEEVIPTQLVYSTKNNAVTVTGSSFYGSKMVLPSHIGGSPVTTLGEKAFENNTNITEIIIPNTVVSFGNCVFRGCSSVTKVTIPFTGSTPSATGASGAFGYIFGMDRKESGNSNYTYSGIIAYQSAGGTYTDYYAYLIPSSIQEVNVTDETIVKDYAFVNCKNITKVNYTLNISKVGENAFKGSVITCFNSENNGFINLPDSTTTIAKSAFENCLNISVLNANCVESYGENAFNGAKNLTKVNSSTYGVLNIKSGCKAIGKYAFGSLTNFTELIVPDSVTSIAGFAFYGCNSLVSVTLPFVGSSIDATGSSAVFGYIFGGRSDSASSTTAQRYSSNSTYYTYIPSTIRNVTITRQTSIPNGAFSGCSNIESINIPDNTTSIGQYEFYNCSSLERLNSNEDGVFNIPSTVTSISDYAFYGCSGATDVRTSNNLTSIGQYAFYNCKNVKYFNSEDEGTFIIPNGCQSIGQYAFYGMKFITDVTIPNSVTSIGGYSFYGFDSLTNITLPFVGASADATGSSAVFGYIFGSRSDSASGYISQKYSDNNSSYYHIPSSIRTVTVTNQTAIPYGAFYGCSFIESIKIPENVRSIGAYAFYNCTGLLNLNSNEEGVFNIPSLVTRIEKYTFSGCGNILQLNSDTPFTLNINEGVTFIGEHAFENCKLIKYIYVPNTVTSIGNAAFYNCSSVVEITIPFVGASSNATGASQLFGYIFSGASSSSGTGRIQQRYGDSSTTYYWIPSTITTVNVTNQTAIPYGAFSGCSFITSISIPSNVTSIGAYAFYSCSSLKRLNSNVDGVFNIPSAVNAINKYCFYQCTQATTINLSNKVKSIGEYAFYDCRNLTKFNSGVEGYMIIPTSCQSIGTRAFYNAKLITNLVVPESVTSIGEGAFYGFSSLTDITIPFVGGSANATGSASVFGYIFGQSTSSNSGWTYQKYSSSSGCYFNIPSTLRNVTVTTQSALPYGAFYSCNKLTSITLLKDADTTADNCLYNCTATVNKTLDESSSAPWNGTSVTTSFSSGSGTAEDPYVINSPAELAYLAQLVNSGNSFEGVYFVLGQDINLNNHGLIIGDSANHPFCGTINGNGFVIKNIKIDSSGTYNGLFGYFDGTIFNVGFEGVSCSISSSSDEVYVGIFGYVTENGYIHDIYVTGSITVTGPTSVFAGPIAGYCKGRIVNSYSNCNVSATSSGYAAYAGGLVGYLDNGTLQGCFAIGNVSAKGATLNYSRNGGLVGTNDNGTIANCYRSSSQTLTRNGVSGSAYNDEGISVSFDGVTAQDIVNGLGWDNSIWGGTEKYPLFI